MAVSKVNVPGIERSFAYRSAITSSSALMRLLTRSDWQGLEHLPPGGCVIAANHISYSDPFAVAQMLYSSGRPPFFLGKESLFRLPVLGRWLAATGQVPVYRNSERAIDAYTDAVEAVKAGKTVVVMAEGTVTKDPDLWPMRAKTGAVRIAIAAGSPLLPLGQWGPQQLLPPGSHRPRLWPRPTMRTRIGAPVDLSDLQAAPYDRDALIIASDRVMDAITEQVAALRGETPPAGRWDPTRGERVHTRSEESP